MGTVYIDKAGCEIRLDGGALVFYQSGRREGVVPIKPLKRVIIVGRCKIDAGVFHYLSKEGIQIVMLSGRSLRFRCVVQGRLHNNGLLRQRQYEKSLNSGFVSKLATELVLRKIQNQCMLLEDSIAIKSDCRLHLSEAIERLNRIQENIIKHKSEIDSLRGYEGTASNFYFSAFTKLFSEGLGFRGRNRRPPRDPVNAMLSLCYTMLYADITTEVYIAGLDPTIGFYHSFEYGRDSLSCDIEEPFRPEVDRFVWELFRKEYFRKRDFTEEKGGVYLKKKARTRFYPLYEEFARPLRKQIQKTLRGIIERLMENETYPLSLPD